MVKARSARARRWSCFSPGSVGVVDGVFVANMAAIAASIRPWMRAPVSGSKVPERRHMPEARSVQVRRRVARRWRSNRLTPPSAAMRSAVACRLAANSSGVDPDAAAFSMSDGAASVSPVLTSPSSAPRTLVNTSTWSPLNAPASRAWPSEGVSVSAAARARTFAPCRLDRCAEVAMSRSGVGDVSLSRRAISASAPSKRARTRRMSSSTPRSCPVVAVESTTRRNPLMSSAGSTTSMRTSVRRGYDRTDGWPKPSEKNSSRYSGAHRRRATDSLSQPR